MAEEHFTYPTPGGAFNSAIIDIKYAVHRAPVWLHAGWINVVWRFRRTLFGSFWHTLSLAAFVIVMGIVWSRILRQDPFDYFRYVSTSIITWSLVSALITDGSSCLIAGQSTVLSMRYPFIALVMEHVWRVFLLFAHHFMLYLAIMVFTLHNPGFPALLAFPGIALVLANGLWMSVLIGMLGLRRRDAGPAISSGMQICMFITPVFWQKDLLGKELAYAADYNPLFHLVSVIREPLLGNMPTAANWIWACGCLVIGGLLTLWIYGRSRDRIIYWY